MEEPLVHQPDRRLQGKELEIRLIVPLSMLAVNVFQLS